MICAGGRMAPTLGLRQAFVLGQPLLPDLVEPRRQTLGEAPGVGEDDGRAVVGDEVDDALLDVRPDARLRRVARGRPRQVGNPGEISATEPDSSPMSGTGTTTSSCHSFVDTGCTISTGRPPAR